MDSKTLNSLLDDINEYLRADAMEHYQKKGIPYRRGYLFHGPPGTGQTTLVHVIASNMPQRGILLIEDIDSAGLVRNPTVSEQGMTLSGYLNATDGFAAPEGHILITTTNRKDSLDEAIIRPGRVDYEVAFTNASRPQIQQLFKNNYRSTDLKDLDSMAVECADNIPEFQISPAKIQQYLLKTKHRGSPKTAITEIAAWISELNGTRSK